MSASDGLLWLAGIAAVGPIAAWIGVHFIVEWLFRGK